jgi:hypothetical protein
MFRNLDLFPPSGEAETPTLLGPLTWGRKQTLFPSSGEAETPSLLYPLTWGRKQTQFPSSGEAQTPTVGSPHLRTETDPDSETLCSLVS